MKTETFTIGNDQAGLRLDACAAELSGITRSRVGVLIEEGLLRVNDRVVKPSYRTKAGDRISVTPPQLSQDEGISPEDIPVEILFADDDVAVINKPAGMVVHPAAGHHSGTLLNAVLHHTGRLASIGGPLRPGVVHRLDKDTSGVIVVALSDKAYYDLVTQFKERSIYRRYRALVSGNLRDDSGVISLQIGRSPVDRKKMSTRVRKGKEALTAWTVKERFGVATLIEARLGTGRTHQIRVHFASIGRPVLGDSTYGKKTVIEKGGKKIVFPRQMLHAESLGFVHPITGVAVEFTVPLPEDMRTAVRELRTLGGAATERT